jgi:hypothetical protein
MANPTVQPSDALDVRAKNKAAEIPEADLQREILSQLYIQNHYITYQYKLIESIKGILTFFVVLTLVSVFGAACIILQ